LFGAGFKHVEASNNFWRRRAPESQFLLSDFCAYFRYGTLAEAGVKPGVKKLLEVLDLSANLSAGGDGIF
jgi:hypothetical protein